MNRLKFLLATFIAAIFTLGIYSCAKEIPIVNKMFGKSSKTELSTRRNFTYALNDYKIWQIKNTVVTVIFPLHDTDKNHIWLVQSQNPHAVDSMLTLINVSFGAYNKNYIKLNYDNIELVYLLTGASFENYPSNAVGLIKLLNPNLLHSLRTLNENTRNIVIDDVQAKATCKDNPTATSPKVDKECKCAGGYGATSCECGGGIATASWHEAVSCGTGKYACCPGL